jgi:fructose-1,6-bisphosphatase/sedoheptulose 1,7-bisphosphatase-like protein
MENILLGSWQQIVFGISKTVFVNNEEGCTGTPEGVIAAAALKCMGGSLQGKLYPRNSEERIKAVEQGYDLEQVRLHASIGVLVLTAIKRLGIKNSLSFMLLSKGFFTSVSLKSLVNVDT